LTITDEILGEICRLVLPIPEESYSGNPDSEIAVCTLSSIDLLTDLAGGDVMRHVFLAGRLLSENRGIDAVLSSLYTNQNIRVLVVCGSDGRGHGAGHSLFRLHRYGVDGDGRIRGSHSPNPYLAAAVEEIEHFCRNIRLVDMMGVTDRTVIGDRIRMLSGSNCLHPA